MVPLKVCASLRTLPGHAAEFSKHSKELAASTAAATSANGTSSLKSWCRGDFNQHFEESVYLERLEILEVALTHRGFLNR